MANNTDFILILPAELWMALFSHLYLPDLFSVNATCRSFHVLALHLVREHRTLRDRYYRLGYEDYSDTYWYPLLLTLIRDPAAAYYVEDLEVEDADRDRATQMEGSETPWMVLPEDEALIRVAVEEEKWIPNTEKGDFLDKLLAGDEHAMVTLMVLRLPNLKRLSLPTYCWGGLDFDYLMPIVARIAQAAARAEEDGEQTLWPLPKLERFEGHIFNCFLGVDFESIAPLMALPSLRTLSTPWNQEEGFDWPTSLPKSRVGEINIEEGTVPREAIIRLAGGIRGPCVIRQKWGFRRYDDTPKHDWDFLDIPFEDADERNIYEAPRRFLQTALRDGDSPWGRLYKDPGLYPNMLGPVPDKILRFWAANPGPGRTKMGTSPRKCQGPNRTKTSDLGDGSEGPGGFWAPKPRPTPSHGSK
ncbi:hypothetical protein DFH07DRAFT_785244 [Mycena maculata]|uniref:F-box domain-containing protein n=1 Tax=Mycena maculata TaxID=230809 RepID=A0AAD7HBP1_9AGAR|nr:hypothetical protein DFH07DRAFT_785244 [Mycena maculata]